MSGHSKWSTIKRKKGAEDKKRSKLFTKFARAISLSVREGGGDDPSTNFKLRLAMDRAKQLNMPKDNIKRAIDHGAGKGTGTKAFERITYEGYGPEGVALIIDIATDNKQRTSSQVKYVLDRNGGSLGSPGSVSFQFDQQGMILVSLDSIDEESLFDKAIDAGAIDVESNEKEYKIFTKRDDLNRIKDVLESANVHIVEADLIYRPTTLLTLDKSKIEKICNIIELLKELDDVQKVYSNANIPSLI